MNSARRTSPSRRLATTFVLSGLLACFAAVALAADATKLLRAADVTPLVGANAQAKPTGKGSGCTWSGATAGRKLGVLLYDSMGVPGEMAYQGARRGAEGSATGKVTDETGMGDKAFSAPTSFGAVVVVLKKGRVFQLQYHTGGAGNAADVVALRAVARKAAAAF